MNRADAPDRASIEALDAFLLRFDSLMATDPRAALRFVEQADAKIRAESEWVLCRTEAVGAVSGPRLAMEYLSGVIADAPDFADAHYYLAELYQQLGDERGAIRHHLETLRLDSAVDSVSEPASAELSVAIAAEAGRVLAELPPQLKNRVSHVPIFLQPRPSDRLVAEGCDSRSLGLFEGPNLADTAAAGVEPEPTAITLFTHCLMDAFCDDEQELLDQVRVTVLHEVGHFFCLDEEQLAELGLE